MKQILIFLLIFLLPFKSFNKELGINTIEKTENTDLLSLLLMNSKREKSSLPSISVLKKAISGYEKLNKLHRLQVKNKLTIIDYSMPSSKKRLWIFDTGNGKILFNCYVAHGKNSGKQFARTFSNNEGSHQSSLGFFITGNTYLGKHGLSLVLEGQENGFNNLAKQRSIVIHGADYVSESIVKQQGYLGRSFGCPALPVNLNDQIIRTIEGGAALFIYAPDKDYNTKSRLIN